MNMSKTMVFFGTDEFSAVSLKKLIADGFYVAAVVTKPDSRKGRGRGLSFSAVKEIALEHSIEVWQPQKLSEITEGIKALDSPIGVLVSYGKIIPQSTIELFSPGIINVHPSLLPKYRGPSPIETAIYNGDSQTGVSIMQLSAAMDAGPVYDQVTLELNGTENAINLGETLAKIGARRLSESLPAIIDGSLDPQAQDESQATYCHLMSKEDAFLTPSEMTAKQAEQKVRAHLVFPKTKITVLNQTIIITKAEVTQTEESELDIKCSDNKYLRITELVGPSGRVMTAAAFLNGYKKN